MKYLYILFISSLLLFASCESAKDKNENKEVKMLKEKIAQFVPVELKYDSSQLSAKQKIVVEKLFEASQLMDSIFLMQVYSKNEEIKTKLLASNDEEDKLKLQYFNIMFGPFDRLDHDKPFIGEKEKPLGANFYPEDMTKDEFNNWIKNHPGDEKKFHFRIHYY